MKKHLQTTLAAFFFISWSFAQAPGNSLEFAGPVGSSSIFVANGGSRPLDISGSITIEAWIRPIRKTSADEANKWNTIMMKGVYGYGLVIGDDNCQPSAVGKLGYWGQNGCGSVPFSITRVEYNKWNHVAVVITGGNLTFYINGDAAGTASGVSIPSGGVGSSLYIGAQDRTSGGNGWFKGGMDEIRIWRTARTAAEIKADMYHEVDPSSSGLVVYYSFDEGIAGGANTGITTVQDRTANNLNGQLDQFTLTGSTSNFVESYAMVEAKPGAASNISTTGFTANWSAPEVGTLDKYLLDVSVDENFTTMIPGYDGLDVGTATSYAVTGLSGANAYYYRLRADKASVTGTGAKSNTGFAGIPVAGLGKALNLESGSSEGLQVTNHSSLNFGTGSFTVEAWIKHPMGDNLYTIVGKQLTGNASINRGYYLRVQGNKIAWALGTSNVNNYAESVTSVADGNWHHIAAVRDVITKKMRVYVDGNLDAEASFSTSFDVTSAANLGVGIKPGFGEYFNGSLDEVRIWSTARTHTQIKEYMNTPLSGTETGLNAYWNFERGVFVADDVSSNDNTGLLLSIDNDNWVDNNVSYAVTTVFNQPVSLRLGGSNINNQTLPTAIISSLPVNGKLYQTNDGITKGPEITSISTYLNDSGGNPRRVIYEPATSHTGSDSFTYQVNNGTLTSINTHTVNVTTIVNAAPTLTGGTSTLSSTNENTASQASVISTLLVGRGYADTDAGALRGIAVTATTANSNWQYSIDGTNWANFGAVSQNAALLLDDNSQVRYMPDLMNGETATFTFSAWDQTAGLASNYALKQHADVSSNGGSTAFSSTTAQVSVSVTDVNDAPVISSNGGGASASVSVPENSTAVTTVTATDVDAGATITYSITGGADQSKFSINSVTGVLVFNSAPNYESPADADANNTYLVNVRAGDGIGNADQNITVTVTDVNESPEITSHGGSVSPANVPLSIAENQASITTVTANDADNVTLTYSISGGLDAALFSITTGGVLTFTTAPDFENPGDNGSDNVYDVIVRVSDGSLFQEQIFTVTVTDVDDTAPAVPSSFTITAGDTQNILNWTANSELDLSGYRVYGGTSASPTTLLSAIASGTTTFIHAGLSNGTFYYYRISAVDNSSNESTLSGDVSGRPKGNQSIAFTALPAKTYGDAAFTVSGTASSGLAVAYASSDPAVASVSGTTVTILKAGTTTITASQAGNDSYNAATNLDRLLTIDKLSMNVLAVVKNKTYGDADPALTYTFTPELVTGDSFSGSLVRTNGEDAGDYIINQGTLSLSNNYDLSFQPSVFNITKKAVTVTAEPKSKTYGDSDPVLTYTFTPALITGDSFSGSLVRTNGEDAGDYIINQGTLSLSNNYDLSFQPSVFNITKKAVTVTAEPKSKTYGDSDPVLTYTFTPALITGDSFNGSLVRTNGEDAGDYIINQGTLSLSNNYDLSFQPSALSVTKKAVTVTAEPKSKTYGNSDPVLTYTFAPALITGDSFSGSLTREVGEDVGIYGISQGSLTLNDNYTLTFQSSALSVTKKAVTVAAEPKNKTYGDSDPVLTYTFTPALVNGDSFTGSLLRVPGENAGAYIIQQGSLALNGSYALSFHSSALTIGKKDLVIKADNKWRMQGEPNPEFTVDYSGLIPGESNNVLITQPLVTSHAGPLSPAGVYAILVNGASATNYEIAYLEGMLIVSPGGPVSVNISFEKVFENQQPGTLVGMLSSTSDNPNATFSYSLVTGSGDSDNSMFIIDGEKLRTGVVFNYEERSTYHIRVQSRTQTGLILEKEFTVNILDVNEPPTLAAIANTTICHTTAVQNLTLNGFSPGPESGQLLSFSVTSDTDFFEQLSITPNGTLSYKVKPGKAGVSHITVIVKDNGGTDNGGANTFSRTFSITVRSLPDVTISTDKPSDISRGEVIVLTALGGATYRWDNAEGIVSGQNTASLSVRPAVSTTYTVTVTSASGCISSKSIVVNVAEDYKTLDANNIISPDGDGKNDRLVIKNIDMYPNNTVTIYDRAGRLIYRKSNYADEWNGTFQGSPLAEDTYYYIVDFGSGKRKLKGYVTILRD